jgi:hypothetical protein
MLTFPVIHRAAAAASGQHALAAEALMTANVLRRPLQAAIPSRSLEKNRGMIPPRISSTRNAPVGILVSGIGCSNQMLHVVLEKPGL